MEVVLLRITPLLLISFAASYAQTPNQVLVVENKQSAWSGEIGAYYMHKRAVPAANLCTIDTTPKEEITRAVYDTDVEPPIGKCLRNNGL